MARQQVLLFLIVVGTCISILLWTICYTDGILRSSLVRFVEPHEYTQNCNAVTPVKDVAPDKASITPQKQNCLIPSDQVLAGLDMHALQELYWRYTNNIQKICHDVRRVGSYGDGGKEVCCDEKFLLKKPCLVYSFGVGGRWDFDEDVQDLFGCEVHSFDPSMHKQDHNHSDNIWFHNLGIGAEDTVNPKNWTIKPLSTIRKELGHEHTTLDILKMDIEGMEWETFRQALVSGTLVDVKQILVEMHPRPNIKLSLTVLRDFYDNGYRIFMRERNMAAHQKYKWTRHSKFRPAFMELALFKNQ